MARKLTPEEAAVLLETSSNPDVPQSQPHDDALAKKLSAKRNTALLLSPESGAWFGIEVDAWFNV
jgi:hypothetical protein